jgi:hypothetical protein
MRISALRVCSACASVPYVHAQHALKGPFQIWNFYAHQGPFQIWNFYAHPFLTRLLNVRIKVEACA